MYLAKARGKGRHEIFDAEMHAQNLALLQMEADLRTAIEQREFQLCYQPIVDLKTGTVSCVEALLRWHHPQQGILLPEAFLSLAEETRLIKPIGEWVFQTACAQAKAWQDSGHRQLRVAVNISSRQFQELYLSELISRVLSETGLEPQFLQLEVSEETAMQDTGLATRMLNELSRMGVRISIDDFGKGASSLSSLKHFPTDTLKIDRSFISDLIENQNGASITSAIIAMAHTLELNVIAEGVETSEQLDFLLDQECDHIQGYLVSRPVPEEELSPLLKMDHDWYGRLFKIAGPPRAPEHWPQPVPVYVPPQKSP
jgi:EAL domain-containing protein (putative c-di-GMP-specific phosphodiesterase class I)